MNRKIKSLIVGTAVAGAMAAGSIAGAAVIFDPATGIGFVGKGDVQLAFDWNNKALQEKADDLEFSVVTTETNGEQQTWVCTNSNNENLQQRARTTTTTSEVAGVFDSVARDKKQITGFTLEGYTGEPDISVGTPETHGPAVDSCPSGPWTLTTPAGTPEPIEPIQDGGVYATLDGGDPVLIG